VAEVAVIRKARPSFRVPVKRGLSMRSGAAAAGAAVLIAMARITPWPMIAIAMPMAMVGRMVRIARTGLRWRLRFFLRTGRAIAGVMAIMAVRTESDGAERDRRPA
jgi:hypothetical protein